MIHSTFYEVYGGSGRIAEDASPEILAMQYLAAQDTESFVCLFTQTQQFSSSPCIVDSPHGRYEGLSAIREFANTWYSRLHLAGGEFEPVVQTRAGMRSVIEFVLQGRRSDRTPLFLPMAAVGALQGDGKHLDSLHIYMHPGWVEDYPMYRPPVFPPCQTHELRHEMLGGIMPHYMKTVHELGVDHMTDCMGKGEILFGGYGPGETAERTTKAKIEEKFAPYRARFQSEGLQEFVQLRMETIIDDGRICCVEWEQLVTERGRKERGRLSEAGFSAYERDENGMLKSVRIIDYANTESQIEWEKTPYDREKAFALNYIG